MNAELESRVNERPQHLSAANEQIHRTVKLLSFQKEQLEDFCNIVSYNLRAPLVNMADKCVDRKEQKLFIDKMKAVTKHLNEVFNELVESLQIRQDTEIKYEFNNLSEYLHKVLNGLVAEINNSHAVINQNFDMSAVIFCPPKYLLSILHNLISNALKYVSLERSPVIDINLAKFNGNSVLSVSDNGLGIDLKKHRENIFKIRKVFHYHPDAKGFGLFITKTHIDAMEGRIWVESKPDQGTTFFVEFKDKQP